jgi:putative endonuclease
MASHNELGKKGEKIAQQYLLDQAFTIVATNWQKAKWEIDIIAQKEKLLVFAEVKSRTGNFFGDPEEAVHAQKEDYLRSAAEAFLEENSFEGEVRFDVIAITFYNEDDYELYHIEDAF